MKEQINNRSLLYYYTGQQSFTPTYLCFQFAELPLISVSSLQNFWELGFLWMTVPLHSALNPHLNMFCNLAMSIVRRFHCTCLQTMCYLSFNSDMFANYRVLFKLRQPISMDGNGTLRKIVCVLTREKRLKGRRFYSCCCCAQMAFEVS